MKKIRVIFDPVKNRANKAEHDGISLAEGGSVLEKDPNALTQFDPDHSDDEIRFATIGISNKNRILFVSHTEFEDDTVERGITFVRIISARKASPTQRKIYEKSIWQ